ncbi:unnamed protein product, partial [Meganyctiphanes norvegica]
YSSVHCTMRYILTFLLPLACAINGEIPVATTRYNATNIGVTDILVVTSERPCPNADDIAPCVCSYNKDTKLMDMDCSLVTSEAELATVFAADFPFTNFNKLIIKENKNITVLKHGVFGVTSFKRIEVTRSAVEVVEEGALNGSMDTAEYISFRFGIVESFPFSTLDKYTSLNNLLFQDGPIEKGFTYCPEIKNSHVYDIHFGSNPLGNIPIGSFSNAPALKKIGLATCDISNIQPGTFKNLINLEWLNLPANHLTELKTGSLISGGLNLREIYLQDNKIEYIEPNAINGTSGLKVHLERNQLKLIEETTWKQIFDAEGELILTDNPLECGCDIAWLYREPSYLLK